MDKRYCVYMHILPEGLVYIGKTSRKPEIRWASGNGYRGQKDIYDLIAYHGVHNFFSFIEHYILSREEVWIKWESSLPYEMTNVFSYEEANLLEKQLISIYDSMNPGKGLNRNSGGDSEFYVSSIAIQRNREAHVGLYDGEKNPFWGMKHSTETKQLLSNLAKLRTGKKNPFFGRKHTEEAKEKNREAHLGKYVGDCNPFYGRHHSQDTKQRLSKLRSIPVEQFNLEGKLIARYPSQLIAAASVGVLVQALNMNCRGKTKTCAGYVFKYVTSQGKEQ